MRKSVIFRYSIGLPGTDYPRIGKKVAHFNIYKIRFRPIGKIVSNWSKRLEDEKIKTLGRVFYLKKTSYFFLILMFRLCWMFLMGVALLSAKLNSCSSRKIWIIVSVDFKLLFFIIKLPKNIGRCLLDPAQNLSLSPPLWHTLTSQNWHWTWNFFTWLVNYVLDICIGNILLLLDSFII